MDTAVTESRVMRVAARILLVTLGSLPLAVLHGLGALLGVLLWLVPNKLQALARRHIAMAFPDLDDAARGRILRESLRHMGMAVLEAPALWFGPRRRLLRWFDPAASARMREIAAGGALILTPHVGSWELAGLFVSSQARVTSLYKPQKGVFDALIKEGRERLGARLVPSTIHGVKALMEALKRGETIGVLPDQDPPWGSGVFAPLFGVPAHTTELVSKLAARTRLPVWFVLAERLPARGYRFHFVALPPDVADVSDGAKGAAALNRGIEQVLRLLPGQYWWSYKRYRRRPPGEPDFY
jgi:Kdo2-lipid IVA lauroyltransferase/acyltransferase